MIMTQIGAKDEYEEFAKRAARGFAENSGSHTYTDGDVEPGCLFALRWGLGDDCVVVFRIDEEEPVVNYQQAIT